MKKWEKYIKASQKYFLKSKAQQYQKVKNQHLSFIHQIQLEKLNILAIFNTNQFKTR